MPGTRAEDIFEELKKNFWAPEPSGKKFWYPNMIF